MFEQYKERDVKPEVMDGPKDMGCQAVDCVVYLYSREGRKKANDKRGMIILILYEVSVAS